MSVNTGPRTKSTAVAVILTFFFGPFGLFYASAKAALCVLAVMMLAGILKGGGMQGLDSPTIMAPLWLMAQLASIAISIVAVRWFNKRQRQ